ncbi:hypothetical protein N7519_009303 [Penicillium mononematosum]|uniref:uncharacterized protein n=1 Tax=Penicillium mononematosum TaxID=268346 RepID=UPI00254914AD|nr:uncharacterized protein N7519_009303 [Penicillium mononematosum]KAJ6178842.1 hypothetical protein N7519_009303 [Penicillium mononematosum]
MYVVTITSVFTGLAVLVVALRLYTRIYMVKAPGLDDLIISCALLSDLALFACILLERKYGIGIHSSKLSEYDLQHQLFWLWLSVPFYNMTMVFAKLSALTLFARLFRLWTTLSGFFFCVPVHAFWNPSEDVRLAKCLPAAPVWFTNAALQTSTDLVILVMPMPLLWKLQLPKRQKWGILVVFSLGIFIIGTSSVRLYPLSVMVGGGDFIEENAQAALWSSLRGKRIHHLHLPPTTPPAPLPHLLILLPP